MRIHKSEREPVRFVTFANSSLLASCAFSLLIFDVISLIYIRPTMKTLIGKEHTVTRQLLDEVKHDIMNYQCKV